MTNLWIADALESLPWYHPDATRKSTIALLETCKEGSYVLRPSSKPGELALSVNTKNKVKHYNIDVKDNTIIFGKLRYTTFEEFVTYLTSNPVIAHGTENATVISQPVERENFSKPSVHAPMKPKPRKPQATNQSTSVDKPVAPPRVPPRVPPIAGPKNEDFERLDINDNDDERIDSIPPFSPPAPPDIAKPSTLPPTGKIQGLTEIINPPRSSTLPEKTHKMLAATKSLEYKQGFLTKRGGNVQNWKTRWFTLEKNRLKYFKEKTDKEPVKTLDLHECENCMMDYTIEKPNCFTLMFSWRKFFIYASTAEDAEEWVAAIKAQMNLNGLFNEN
ncbi:unnamed protein product [Owenia fusiformis]|uniref:Uncharacterized protein n=1 Tax=Owenia fusiformis TaxID=6347 RepID=A0A8J1UQN0_OWEFU|nr:unnamed protein product [Owenia fusiformis]